MSGIVATIFFFFYILHFRRATSVPDSPLFLHPPQIPPNIHSMFRKRVHQWVNGDEIGDPPCAFSEPFWQHYVDSLLKPVTPSTCLQPDTHKYTSVSQRVAKLKGYLRTFDDSVSTHMGIALLKSPFSQGDPTRAYHLARFFQLSEAGLFITNDGHDRKGAPIALQGAENWENVMCYMDALLFSMFANLESFEPILFILNQHTNPLVYQLLALLRLYVNLMRSGNLITTDLTQRICECLYKLGSEEALSHRQHDPAPVFEFLTQTLLMPLLTFRVEIQHRGKVDEDDTKYSNERILFVSIPEDEKDEDSDLALPSSGASKSVETGNAISDPPAILLEECLENYFNNSILVRRELQRRATLESQKDDDAALRSSRKSDSSLSSRKSTTSIPRTRSSTLSMWSSDDSKPNEVSLPAWMLLRLLPFYTDDNDIDHANNSVAKNSREFANRRPVLPICLKRYSFSSSNLKASRSRTRVIIPPVIDLPKFVADGEDEDSTHTYRLILESAVCHRGTSINSGHFVSAVRKNTHLEDEELDAALDAEWYLYDDLKKTRVEVKTFSEIFDTEWPYFLFYRLVASEPKSAPQTPFVPPVGHRAKYWADTQLTPIVSRSELDLVVTLDNRTGRTSGTTDPATDCTSVDSKNGRLADGTDTKDGLLKSPKGRDLKARDVDGKTLEASAKGRQPIAMPFSEPIPDCAPDAGDFVDIRRRYLWYVTDKEMNYYKESASHSKSGSHSWSISLTPHYRRNSQWSETSNISGLALEPDALAEALGAALMGSLRKGASKNGSLEPGSISGSESPKVEHKSGKPELKSKKSEPISGEREPKTDKTDHKEDREHNLHRKVASEVRDEPQAAPRKHHFRHRNEYRREKCTIT